MLPAGGAGQIRGSRPALIIAAFSGTAIVLGFFAVDTLQSEPATFVAIILLGLLSVVLDAIVRHGHQPKASPRSPAGRPPVPSP